MHFINSNRDDKHRTQNSKHRLITHKRDCNKYSSPFAGGNLPCLPDHINWAIIQLSHLTSFFLSMRARILWLQECIPVRCVPLAPLFICMGRGCKNAQVLPLWTDIHYDTRFWQYYLAPQLRLTCGNNEMVDPTWDIEDHCFSSSVTSLVGSIDPESICALS